MAQFHTPDKRRVILDGLYNRLDETRAAYSAKGQPVEHLVQPMALVSIALSLIELTDVQREQCPR